MDFMEDAKQISLFCRMNMNSHQDLPIRSSEMGLLIYLVKTNNEKVPKAIAEFFKVTKAMVTNMVSSLTKQEYVYKQVSLLDKRSVLIIPTQKAIDLVESTYKEYYKHLMLLSKQMGSDDFNQLIVLIEKANRILLEDKDNG